MPDAGTISRRILPFAGAAVLGLLLSVVPDESLDSPKLIGSLALTVAIVVVGAFAPWQRLPVWSRVCPPLAYLVAVALLRDSGGGANAGFGPLLLLPVFWVALYGTGKQLAVLLAGVAAVFYVPMLMIGGDAYPATGWRAGALFVVVAAIVGFTVLDLIARLRKAHDERALLVHELERLATTDSLTGLPNRRGWEEALRTALTDASRRKTPLTVAMLDLDHFKRVNDVHGHSHGDMVLRQSAAAWKAQLRPDDVIARVGGEEFAVLLRACTGADAWTAIERVRMATLDGHTASAGVVQWDGAEPADAVVTRADAMLYEAKRLGRDRTVSAGGAQPPLLRAV